jgi:outer membrane immunogenic protein
MTSNFLMSVQRGVALAVMFTAMSPVVAFATDLPVPMYSKAPPVPRAPAPYIWSGLYAGGHLGYLWGRTHVDDDGVTTERNARTDGIIGGAMIGYNWQIERTVFGLEGDIGWTNAHGVGTSPEPEPAPAPAPPAPLIPVTTHGPNSYDVRWTSHLRGRVGYTFDNWLVFVAGGLALADLDFREGTITTTFVQAPASGGKYYGWSVGGGVEWAFARNLFARVEYLYDDYGHKDYVGVLGDRYRVSLTGQTVRGALGFKFDPCGR